MGRCAREEGCAVAGCSEPVKGADVSGRSRYRWCHQGNDPDLRGEVSAQGRSWGGAVLQKNRGQRICGCICKTVHEKRAPEHRPSDSEEGIRKWRPEGQRPAGTPDRTGAYIWQHGEGSGLHPRLLRALPVFRQGDAYSGKCALHRDRCRLQAVDCGW